MVWFAAMLSFTLMLIALLLLTRVQRTIRAAQILLRGEGSCPTSLLPLERLVSTAFDTSLTPTLRQPDPARLELTHREYHDPYQDLAGLLSWVRQNADTENPSVLEEVIKAICQLAFTLQQPGPALEVCLAPFANRLRQLLGKDRGEGKVVYVQPGELIETGRMMPLNYGSRVMYPLGVIVLDAAGRVLSKARVLSA
jgi:hypothetical protein